MPRNTPASLPSSRSGASPARSSASHATSSTRRCCGSISSASRGEMPKNAASNWSMSSRNPPHRVCIFPGRPGSGAYQRSRSQRSGGTSRIASLPPRSKFQNAGGSDVARAGNRRRTLAHPRQVARQRLGVRMIEDHRRGQRATERGPEPADQLHRHHGRHAELPEPAARIDRGGVRDLQHTGQLSHHQVADRLAVAAIRR